MLWRQTFTSSTLPLDFGPAPQSTSSRTCQRQAGESSLSINPDKSEGCHDNSTDSEELRSHCHLGFIHIRGTFDGYQEYVMLPFLISCSERLKKLERPDTTHYGNANIGGALSYFGVVCLTLNDRKFPRGRHSSDSAIAEVIEPNPQLTKIDIPACYNVGHLATAAVLNITNLEFLNVRSCKNLTSKHLHAILCQARNLKHLTFTCEDYCGAETVVLRRATLPSQNGRAHLSGDSVICSSPTQS